MGKFDDLRKSLNKSKKKLFSKSAAVGSSDSNGSGNGNGNANVDHGINSGTTVVNSVDKTEEDGKIINISSDDLQKILSTKKKMSLSSTTDSVVPMLRVRTIDSTTTPISGSRGHGSRRRYKSSASMSGSSSVTSKTKQRRKKNNNLQEQNSSGSVISNISNGSDWTTLATSDTVVTTTTKQYENELSNYVSHMLFISPVVSIITDGIMLLSNVTEEGEEDDGRSGIGSKIKNSKSYDSSGGPDDDHTQTAFEQLKQKSAMKKKSYTDTRTIPSSKRSFVKDYTKDATTSKQRQQLLLQFKNERQSQNYKRNEIAMKRISPRSSRTATATATTTSKTQQLLFLSHDHDYHSLVGIDCGDECRDVINENNRDDQ
ncbi:hypothetical protein FRACYDRAFT_235263 [Fragilariopsis cylindrus CCMP1102]|uniref:Uncharacterized protein n=1 Tax=Fragilariopsis cylindrus CCMP1102 TaxID=635003 RepID=A0A1E7FU49_9STRA|nr:hypothetical protein FRACYDRAFT_235263 [Fragilariopsis cylindrus CCMP1102]|eukprot:OEU21637.1 hypothetical protein FRACYDRAFT_235263 [Fragilariopsis cylindrus CCMP1102]